MLWRTGYGGWRITQLVRFPPPGRERWGFSDSLPDEYPEDVWG